MSARRKGKPAGDQHGWNVYRFPDGRMQARSMTENARIRRQYLRAVRELETLNEMIYAVNGDAPCNASIAVLENIVWVRLVNARIVY